MKYMILWETTLAQLEKAVNTRLTQGWTLVGGPIKDSSGWYQGMTLKY